MELLKVLIEELWVAISSGQGLLLLLLSFVIINIKVTEEAIQSKN
jgi:hypothetical protein